MSYNYMWSFIPERRDPTFVLPRFRLAGTKFSHVIALARLTGMQKLINISEKIQTSAFQ